MERISESERIASFSLALANARDLSHGVAPETASRLLETYFPSRKERTNAYQDRIDVRDGGGSAGRDGGASGRPAEGFHFWLGAEGHAPAGRGYAARRLTEAELAVFGARLNGIVRIEPGELADGLYRSPAGHVFRVDNGTAEARSRSSEEGCCPRCGRDPSRW